MLVRQSKNSVGLQAYKINLKTSAMSNINVSPKHKIFVSSLFGRTETVEGKTKQTTTYPEEKEKVYFRQVGSTALSLG
jgi:hypothetical protein